MICLECPHRHTLYCFHPNLLKRYETVCPPKESQPKWCPLKLTIPEIQHDDPYEVHKQVRG